MRQRCGKICRWQQTGSAEIAWQPHRDTGATADQRVMRSSFADRNEMRIGHCIDDGVTATVFLQSCQRVADGIIAAFDDRKSNQADPAIGLTR